jgi:hypothetical protein
MVRGFPIAGNRPSFKRARQAVITSTVTLNAPVEATFAYLDDFKNLSAHMETPSGMMMGSKMMITTDALGGQTLGSKVRMEELLTR